MSFLSELVNNKILLHNFLSEYYHIFGNKHYKPFLEIFGKIAEANNE